MKVIANKYKGSYSIIRDNGEVYEYNNSRHDQNGKEYIHIPLFTETDMIDGYAYQCRLIDMVNQIRNGEGDYVAVGRVFDEVGYYLDREYGEKVRQRTLEGFKDLPTDATGRYFIYVIGAMKYYYGIDKEFHAMIGDIGIDPMLFTSEKDADDYIQKSTKDLEFECIKLDKGEIDLDDINSKWIFSCKFVEGGGICCQADIGQWTF